MMKDVQLKQNHILYPKSVSDLEKMPKKCYNIKQHI